MLASLNIKNYALIDQMQVQFDQGFTTITGETGAGKSILLGGLSLILGKRADLNSLRDPSEKCVLEAVFNIKRYGLQSFFEAEDLDYEDQTIIRREILPSGKSRAFINDTPVTLGVLSALGEQLVDIHSQHQTLKLTENDFQFRFIDAVAQNVSSLATYGKELKELRRLEKDLREMVSHKQEAVKEYDYNQFLLKELQEARLQPGMLEELEETYEKLNNVELIKEQLGYGLQILEDEQMGVNTLVTDLKNTLKKLSGFGEVYQELAKRIESVFIELDDAGNELRDLEADIEADPAQLEETNTKLQQIYALQKKHGVMEIEELLSIQEELENKVISAEGIDERISEQEELIREKTGALNELADRIRANRLKVIPQLKEDLEKALAPLGMPNARFSIELTPTGEFGVNGKDDLLFLFSANTGGSFNELRKVASGGELSRIMLVIKAMLAQYMALPTIMFDEIDTGVSGEVSNKMAAIMQQMSQGMQVFTITHLPQVAAKGNRQYKVYKTEKDGKTYSDIRVLEDTERINELAEMLGGKQLTDSALAHARELLTAHK
ncbi:DNA repair protein RecN [Robertkochia marina]|uniref:DNA repair protein RecN n=1 Tax=Robertkochia marina TaxID=1227945 RepID=A0A4S3M1I2_9FLAO|nr:DNA repair protein RecN [Robertkochia marina]THD68048.1 DNA repair protein RecN [Robertkochia marina]TRZ42668.1 DNA repair protein RecN [Robertkochia marina]